MNIIDRIKSFWSVSQPSPSPITPSPITLALLQRMWPHGDSKVPGLLEGIANAAPTVFPKYGATTNIIIAHALAQFSHECGAGTEMIENIHYSAARACQVWPSRFISEADCYAKVGSSPSDPDFHIKLIDSVYGGRMGNFEPHDGSTFIGRGLAQTTGRDGYKALADKTGLDVLNHPDLVSSPANALECGMAEFVICGCLPFAQKDNLLGVSAMLNVGHLVSDPRRIVGFGERQAWFAHWKQALGV